MRASAQRAPSARLAAMPAVISVSSVARSTGPRRACGTWVRPRAISSSAGSSREMPSICMILVGGRPALADAGGDDEPLDLGKPPRAEVLQPVEVLVHPGVPRRGVLAGD